MRVHELWAGLLMDDVPVPEPGPGQVRLKIHACGVNFADTLIVKGRYQEKPPLPFAPGMEVCGTVHGRGEGVTEPAVGTRVAASCGAGGFAEYALAPASACVPIPDAMSDIQAAAFQVAYGTSHVALGHKANLQPGERLLVLGAAGGVGLTAVEIGKLMGAEVIAVARGANRLELVRAVGADHLIDSQTADIREAVKALGGADVVYDPVGGPHTEAALRATAWNGRLLVVGFAAGEIPKIPANLLLLKGCAAMGVFWGQWMMRDPATARARHAELLTWIHEGKLAPRIHARYPLSEAAHALRDLLDRSIQGKAVLITDR
jgi:NADPH2:quinone reductase